MTSLVTRCVYASTAQIGGRVETVQSLRGLACLAVVLLHFSSDNPRFYVPPLLRAIAAKGELGVEVFFVISGFILPYSLWRAGYQLSASNFGRFLWKRVLRLDPPYICTIALILLLRYLSTLFHGIPFRLDRVQLGLHVGYLNALAGLTWLNPVFWTLAIEFQFYILIAIIFPLVISGNRIIRIAAMGLLLIASLLYPNDDFVTYYFPLFICGIVAFQWLAGICATWEAALMLPAATTMLSMRMGVLTMLVGLATAFFIVAMPSWTNAPLAFLGTMSYSLYLLHVPIGDRVINLAQQLPPSAMVTVAGMATAAAVSIGAASVLYRFVERPAQHYAGSLQFAKKHFDP